MGYENNYGAAYAQNSLAGACSSHAPAPKQIGPATEALYSIENRLRELVNTMGRTESSLAGPRPCDPTSGKDSVDTLLASLQRISGLTDAALQLAYSIDTIVSR